jgi:hypothetical protein
MDETPIKTTFHNCHCLVFVAPVRSYERKGARFKSSQVDRSVQSEVAQTFDIVWNCLGTFKLVEGRWAGYGACG